MTTKTPTGELVDAAYIIRDARDQIRTRTAPTIQEALADAADGWDATAHDLIEAAEYTALAITAHYEDSTIPPNEPAAEPSDCPWAWIAWEDGRKDRTRRKDALAMLSEAARWAQRDGAFVAKMGAGEMEGVPSTPSPDAVARAIAAVEAVHVAAAEAEAQMAPLMDAHCASCEPCARIRREGRSRDHIEGCPAGERLSVALGAARSTAHAAESARDLAGYLVPLAEHDSRLS